MDTTFASRLWTRLRTGRLQVMVACGVGVVALVAGASAALPALLSDGETFVPSPLGARGPIQAATPPIAHVLAKPDDLLSGSALMTSTPIAQVDWAAAKGRWLALVFAQIPDSKFSEFSARDAWLLGRWTAALRYQLNRQVPNAELWLVRTNLPVPANEPLLGRKEFRQGCMSYSAGCFDRFLGGYYEPGADGLHFAPMFRWLLTAHGEEHLSRGKEVSFPTPVLMLVSPAGELIAVSHDDMRGHQLPTGRQLVDLIEDLEEAV